MRRAERAAFYILVKMNGLKFYQYDPASCQQGLTSCPHDATLFTSSKAAYEHADRLRRDVAASQGSPVDVSVMPTRTHAPNVLTGA